jgi:hypothetical protein
MYYQGHGCTVRRTYLHIVRPPVVTNGMLFVKDICCTIGGFRGFSRIFEVSRNSLVVYSTNSAHGRDSSNSDELMTEKSVETLNMHSL